MAALAAAHAPPARAQRICAAGTAAQVPTSLGIAARSPLYRFAVERLGPATGCRASKDDDGERLVLSFAHGAALTVSSSPVIEYASLALSLGRPAKPVTRAEAVAALRSTEIEATGPSGCGIAWSGWRASPGDVALSGDACNCKATVEVKRGAVLALAFSTAC